MAEEQRRKVAELAPAENIGQVFMISQPVLRTTSRGDFYIAAFLSDCSGRINGRMWQASEAIYESLPQEGFVWVKGRTEIYQGSIQLVIDAIRPVDVHDVQLEEFLPTSENDIDEMFARLKGILSEIEDPHLVRLNQAFLDDEELMDLFRSAPAAIVLHHAYIGGLLEHTVSMLELGRRVMPQYPDLNKDLVLSGLFLHDIGKTTELAYDLSFKYSDQGRLIGHLVKGTIMVEEKIRQLNEGADEQFPRILADCLEHIIVSHHGNYEFGCPVLPATTEAFVVHYLDNLDSKVAMTQAEIRKDTNKSNWTSYIRAIESPLFKGAPNNRI
jgi:3'-5' exoribonuclease